MTSISLYQPGNISTGHPFRGRWQRQSLDVTIDIPSAWNELTKEELLFICKKLIEIEVTGYAGKAEILLFMISDNASIQKKQLPKYWQHQLSADDVSINGLDTINWIFESADLTSQLILSISLPGRLHRGELIYGPQSNFDDITCGEFEDTEVFFNLYNDNKEVRNLAMITAILWRTLSSPLQGMGVKRTSYSDYDTENFIPAVMILPAEILLANYLWYIGCRQLLPKLFPETFSKSGGKPDLSAFTKCIHAGAGPKNGTREQIRKTLLKEFFLDMELEAQKTNDESK